MYEKYVQLTTKTSRFQTYDRINLKKNYRILCMKKVSQLICFYE